MSKELEQLNEIFDYITGESKEFNSVQIIDKVIDIKLALYRLEKLETPPTSDEVCKALSEYYGTDVKHQYHEHDDINETFLRDVFYFGKVKHDMNGKEYTHRKDIVAGGNDGVSINAYLPPHLITLIGRFYQGLEEGK